MSPGGNVFRDKVMILLDLDLGASDWSALSAIAVLKGQAEIQLKTAEAAPMQQLFAQVDIDYVTGLKRAEAPPGKIYVTGDSITDLERRDGHGQTITMPGGPHVPNSSAERCVNCGTTWPPHTSECRAANLHGVNFP